MKMSQKSLIFVVTLTCVAMGITGFTFFASTPIVEASSHGEAPTTSHIPKMDGTDFFMFQSYSEGDDDLNQNDRTVLIANYIPLQDPFAGPSFFFPQQDARYIINIENDGNADEGKQDLQFVFEFVDYDVKNDTFRNLAVETDDGTFSEIPLLALNGIADVADAGLNIVEAYELTVFENGKRTQLNNDDLGGELFFKPFDNAGDSTIPDYTAYAAQHVFSTTLPDGSQADVFVGQRDDPFVVNLGEVFDFVDIVTNNIDAINAKNVTSFCIEVDTAFLTNQGAVDIIGGFTTSETRNYAFQNNPKNPDNSGNNPKFINGIKFAGGFKQVSRLGFPLVNELVIGYGFKDDFNASEPRDDLDDFARFVTNPALAVVFNLVLVLDDVVPTADRQDIVAAAVTGADAATVGIDLVDGSIGEMQRLNVTQAPTAQVDQLINGLLDADLAGFPNGRRLGDDVVDIVIRVVGGQLIGLNVNDADLTDLAETDPNDTDNDFPFVAEAFAGDDVGLIPLAKKLRAPRRPGKRTAKMHAIKKAGK